MKRVGAIALALFFVVFGAVVIYAAPQTQEALHKRLTEDIIAYMKQNYLYPVNEDACRKEIFERFQNPDAPVFVPNFAEIERRGAKVFYSQCFDEHSRIFSPQELTAMLANMNQRYEGVGIEVVPDTSDKTLVVVYKTFAGGAAEKAGIKKGDIVVSARQSGSTHSEPIDSIQKAVALLKGPEGTIVYATILRDGKLKEYKLVRARVKIPTVIGKKVSTARGEVGYVRITSFAGEDPDIGALGTADDLMIELRKFKRTDGVKPAIVLDFRGNQGGNMRTALEMLYQFSSYPKDIKLSIRNGDGSREILTIGNSIGNYADPTRCRTIMENEAKRITKKICAAKPPGEFEGWHFVILINGGSASASEIISGTLQDWGKSARHNIVVVGTVSFGKGVGQTVINIPHLEGWALTLTTFEFLVGNSQSPIQGIGIRPDFEIPDTVEIKHPDDFETLGTAADAPFVKALELFQNHNWH